MESIIKVLGYLMEGGGLFMSIGLELVQNFDSVQGPLCCKYKNRCWPQFSRTEMIFV